jgi:hypothetical protein
MKRRQAVKSNYARTILLVGVLACLCFSAGEGLRLTPFPVSIIVKAEASDSQLTTNTSRENSLHPCGPMYGAMQVYKRGKRQVLESGCPPAKSAYDLPTNLLSWLKADETINPPTAFSGARCAGRAPPFTS